MVSGGGGGGGFPHKPLFAKRGTLFHPRSLGSLAFSSTKVGIQSEGF